MKKPYFKPFAAPRPFDKPRCKPYDYYYSYTNLLVSFSLFWKFFMNKKIILFALSASLVAACVARESRESFMPTTKETQRPAKTPEKNFITVKHNPQKGLWEQLTTQRSAEHDLQATIAGVQVNLSQIANMIAVVPVTPIMIMANDGYWRGKDDERSYLMSTLIIGANIIVIKCVYGYFSGKQKNPFRIIPQEPSAPESQTNEDELNA